MGEWSTGVYPSSPTAAAPSNTLGGVCRNVRDAVGGVGGGGWGGAGVDVGRPLLSHRSILSIIWSIAVPIRQLYGEGRAPP